MKTEFITIADWWIGWIKKYLGLTQVAKELEYKNFLVSRKQHKIHGTPLKIAF